MDDIPIYASFRVFSTVLAQLSFRCWCSLCLRALCLAHCSTFFIRQVFGLVDTLWSSLVYILHSTGFLGLVDTLWGSAAARRRPTLTVHLCLLFLMFSRYMYRVVD